MNIPGFEPLSALRPKGVLRRLMIGIDGPPNAGKSEFALSAPGPVAVVCLDRGLDPLLDNPKPPKARCTDIHASVIAIPQETAATQDQFIAYWQEYKRVVYGALAVPEIRTVVLDGDSDSYELQRMAEFNKTRGVPPLSYAPINAQRKAFYTRCWDSKKIIIATHKVSKTYADKLDKLGNPILSDKGLAIREWDGTWERQGFQDQGYLWHIQLRGLFEQSAKGPRWGIRIMECKPNMELIGEELWGSECNLQSLCEAVYPNVDPKEWGFK